MYDKSDMESLDSAIGSVIMHGFPVTVWGFAIVATDVTPTTTTATPTQAPAPSPTTPKAQADEAESRRVSGLVSVLLLVGITRIVM